eukprot:scaffold85931_cov31-Attheya_sp.AAC.1
MRLRRKVMTHPTARIRMNDLTQNNSVSIEYESDIFSSDKPMRAIPSRCYADQYSEGLTWCRIMLKN